MMQRLTWSEMVNRYDLDGSTLNKQLEACGLTPCEHTWLAGGALRRTIAGMPMVSDLDFFFAAQEHLNAAKTQLESRGFKRQRGSDFNETWTGKCGEKTLEVQLIKIAYYPSPEALIDSFDFTICQLAYDGTTLYCGDYTLFDVGRKRLAVHKVTFGASTVRRLLKYTKQGYTACQGTFVTILETVAKDPAVIRGEVEYVD